MGKENEYESDSEDLEKETDPEDSENESNSEESVTRSDEDLKTKIFSTLKGVKTPSAFAFSAIDVLLANPVLSIPPYGTLGLPLSTDDAQKIIAQARHSPFGKGEKTVVDTTVRKSWELNPNQFSLKNPAWNKAVKTIVDSVTTGLGLAKGAGKISAKLHKLLLYEPGAFFKPHKDSEKAPGLFATLVVCLPSQHKGGKLVMTHDGEKYEFETAKSSAFGSSYAVWYSDITHEVQPVVSGYRLVLVYNLIRQANFEVPSHDLVRGHIKQLSTLLQECISRLKRGDDKLPPVLLHKLKHKYSQVSLKFNALKPQDLAQVQVLRQLSTKLGFGIYLATLELVVNKDDEDPDDTNMQFRHQSLENFVELDGKLVAKTMDYPEGALIDPAGQSEDVADGEEHEGPTGNEGSPATYWYRDTVVALVPPSRQLHVVFKFKFDGSVIKPLFSKLMQDFAQDPAQKPKLEQLCKLALKQVPEKCHSYQCDQKSEPIPAFFRQAAETALDLGCGDVFDEAYKVVSDKIMLGDAHVLGRSAAANGIVATTERLMNCILAVSSIAKKLEFLNAVFEGFTTAVPQPSSAERESLKQWVKEAIFSAVAKLKTLTKDDGVYLARLCRNNEWSQFESKVKPVVLKAVTKAKITFVNKLMSILQPELDEAQLSFVKTVIRSIWNEFVFEAKNQLVPQESLYPHWYLQEREKERVKDNLKEDDILLIVEHSITVLSSKCVETTIIPAMLAVIPTASKNCTKELFVPLVQVILENKLPVFRLRTNETVPPPSHKRLVQALLTKFFSENVSPEPEPRTNFSLPAGSCKCSDCAIVNKFLQDPVRETLEFPRLKPVKQRREHLNKIFSGYNRLSTITNTCGGSGSYWKIEKRHRSKYKSAKSQWEWMTGYATKSLSEWKNNEVMNGRLKAYLEPYYSIIVNFKVRELLDLKSLVTPRQLSASNENTASALSQPTNQSGPKRGAGNGNLPEHGLAKRPRS